MFEEAKRARMATIRWVLPILLVAACEANQEPQGLSSTKSDLYLLGPTWPSGVVQVCYDSTDGNNQPLLAQARTLLADTWSQAANVSFQGWGPCNYASPTPPSIVAVHFAAGTSGVTAALGPVSGSPGVNNLTLVSDDSDPFQQHFRYEVVHEFGHALGFAHEQERPDNWNAAGNAIFCPLTQAPRKGLPGGTYETSYFDTASVMDYCTTEPLVGGGYRTFLSSGDIFGARNVYGRNGTAHGFMIHSDTNSGLAVNAWGGAADGTTLKLSSACTISNPDCTWTYQYGMLVSDTDPSLAINAWAGAAEGTVLKLARACTPSNPDCTWTYKNGQFLSDTNPSLAINAFGGAQNGTTLVTTAHCSASNPDCTWTMPNIMFSSARNIALAVNAYGGAANSVALKLVDNCATSNADCTFTFSKGMLVSDQNTGLAVNAWGGAANGTVIRLSNACSITNPDCTWQWSKGELISDNSGATPLPINASGGAVAGASLLLNSACTATNADCVFSGFYARN